MQCMGTSYMFSYHLPVWLSAQYNDKCSAVHFHNYSDMSQTVTTDGLKKFLYFRRTPWGLRPVAFATSATWLIRHSLGEEAFSRLWLKSVMIILSTQHFQQYDVIGSRDDVARYKHFNEFLQSIKHVKLTPRMDILPSSCACSATALGVDKLAYAGDRSMSHFT